MSLDLDPVQTPTYGLRTQGLSTACPGSRCPHAHNTLWVASQISWHRLVNSWQQRLCNRGAVLGGRAQDSAASTADALQGLPPSQELRNHGQLDRQTDAEPCHHTHTTPRAVEVTSAFLRLRESLCVTQSPGTDGGGM